VRACKAKSTSKKKVLLASTRYNFATRCYNIYSRVDFTVCPPTPPGKRTKGYRGDCTKIQTPDLSVRSQASWWEEEMRNPTRSMSNHAICKCIHYSLLRCKYSLR
jgi:hypothetical protein